jgi:hypothetical protein
MVQEYNGKRKRGSEEHQHFAMTNVMYITKHPAKCHSSGNLARAIASNFSRYLQSDFTG